VPTAPEVAAHTSFKPFPKTAAGLRTVPLPGWLVEILREHPRRWPNHPNQPNQPIFPNEVGGPLRHGLFRGPHLEAFAPAAGLLGQLSGNGPYTARWTDARGVSHERTYRIYPQAAMEVAGDQSGGMRFHDLRPLCHVARRRRCTDQHGPTRPRPRKSSTTLDIYTRRTDNSARILQALDNYTKADNEDDSDDGGAAGVLVPV
jgi:integrase